MALDTNKTILSVLILKEEREKLRVLAEMQERSMSQMAAILIREGIDKYLNNT